MGWKRWCSALGFKLPRMCHMLYERIMCHWLSIIYCLRILLFVCFFVLGWISSLRLAMWYNFVNLMHLCSVRWSALCCLVSPPPCASPNVPGGRHVARVGNGLENAGGWSYKQLMEWLLEKSYFYIAECQVYWQPLMLTVRRAIMHPLYLIPEGE